MNDLSADKMAIREIVENWILYRDAGDWEPLRHRLACGRLDDCHLVPGTGHGIH